MHHRWKLTIAALLPAPLRAKVDAEDVLQEVLQRAWRELPQLDEPSPPAFDRWVNRILERRVIDVVRHYGREQRDAGRELDSVAVGDLEVHTQSGESPAVAAARREQRARIVAVLDTLRKSYRDVVVLRILQGYSTREVAGILECSEENVAVTLHRALVRFREALLHAGLESTMFRPLREV